MSSKQKFDATWWFLVSIMVFVVAAFCGFVHFLTTIPSPTALPDGYVWQVTQYVDGEPSRVFQCDRYQASHGSIEMYNGGKRIGSVAGNVVVEQVLLTEKE